MPPRPLCVVTAIMLLSVTAGYIAMVYAENDWTGISAMPFAAQATTTGAAGTTPAGPFPVPGEGQGCQAVLGGPKFPPCPFAPNGMTNATFVDSKGVARYPVGTLPVMDPQTGETLIDELGRRSFTTSIAYGPSVGKNIALAYLPWAYAQQGRKLVVEYFGETYPVEVAAVGYKPLYDPENLKPRS